MKNLISNEGASTWGQKHTNHSQIHSYTSMSVKLFTQLNKYILIYTIYLLIHIYIYFIYIYVPLISAVRVFYVVCFPNLQRQFLVCVLTFTSLYCLLLHYLSFSSENKRRQQKRCLNFEKKLTTDGIRSDQVPYIRISLVLP